MKKEYLYKSLEHNENYRDDSLNIEWKEYLEDLENKSSMNNIKMKNSIKYIKKILNQYEIIFNGTQDALFLVQMLEDGNFLYIKNNDSYLEKFNLKREDIINKTPFDVFGDELGKRVSDHYRECILSEKVIIFEEELDLPIGRKVLLTKLTPIIDEEYGKFVVGSRSDITDIKEMELKLNQMANYDKLTRIPNRRMFFKEFNRVLEKAKMKNKNFAVLFMDLDSFKEVNDTYGHEAGDKVLVSITKRIESCIRESDILARLGGDEFAIILDNIRNKEDIERIINRIQSEIKKDIKLFNGCSCNVDSSIGVALYPVDGNNMKILMKNADVAMYKVKNNTKGGYKFFSNIDEYKFKSKDGHVHTSYCPHGTDDEMESYIIEGIKLGLSEISFTEHLPLPRNFDDPSPLKDSAMDFNDLQPYLDECEELKLKYSSKIKVNIGVEVDYIEGYEEEIKKVLDDYGSFLDDGVLSVHMIKGRKDKYYCIDFSAEEFQKIIDDLGSLEEVYNKYYDTLILALNKDLGEYKPKRIGHLNLIRKFNKKFPYDYNKFLPKIENILDIIKEKGYELDFNIAGLRKEECGELYVEKEILKLAMDKKIPMILGSDSHSSKYIKTLKDFL